MNNYYPNYNQFYNQPMQQQVPKMQPMEQSYPQYTQPTPMYKQAIGLQGKSVDSVDVVKAMDIPLDGSISYFPLTDGSAIVSKQLLQDGRIEGAVKVGNSWNIPIDADKPVDKRIIKPDDNNFIIDLDDNYFDEVDSLKKELDIIKRARNHKSRSSKSTDIITYKHSTAFEALIGYLYYKNDKSRIEEIINYIKQK